MMNKAFTFTKIFCFYNKYKIVIFMKLLQQILKVTTVLNQQFHFHDVSEW